MTYAVWRSLKRGSAALMGATIPPGDSNGKRQVLTNSPRGLITCVRALPRSNPNPYPCPYPSSKVIQPIVEPAAPADGHTGVEHLQATWEAIEGRWVATAPRLYHHRHLLIHQPPHFPPHQRWTLRWRRR